MTGGAPDSRDKAEYVDTTEAAAYLGVSASTIARWCRNDTLPGVKINDKWWIHRNALENRLRARQRAT